jgi:Flp pilus assembly pilin Flp
MPRGDPEAGQSISFVKKTKQDYRVCVMKSKMKNFVKNEDGASLVEYVLLCVLIGVAAIIGMQAVGTNANAVLNNIATSINK